VDAARVEKLTHEMWDAYGFRKSSPRLPQLLAGRHLAKLPRDLSQELPHKAWEMQISWWRDRFNSSLSLCGAAFDVKFKPLGWREI
jgi:hypothetical protein